MKDQVDSLTALGVNATFLNSSIDSAQSMQRLRGLRRGDFPLVRIVESRPGRTTTTAELIPSGILPPEDDFVQKASRKPPPVLSSAPLAINALLYPARKITLYGRSAPALSIRYAAEAACQGHEVVYICGDNRFDPYAIARIAGERKQNRDMVLSRVFVARAFTGNGIVRSLRPLIFTRKTQRPWFHRLSDSFKLQASATRMLVRSIRIISA